MPFATLTYPYLCTLLCPLPIAVSGAAFSACLLTLLFQSSLHVAFLSALTFVLLLYQITWSLVRHRVICEALQPRLTCLVLQQMQQHTKEWSPGAIHGCVLSMENPILDNQLVPQLKQSLGFNKMVLETPEDGFSPVSFACSRTFKVGPFS